MRGCAACVDVIDNPIGHGRFDLRGGAHSPVVARRGTGERATTAPT
jgi:hypothetical protein